MLLNWTVIVAEQQLAAYHGLKFQVVRSSFSKNFQNSAEFQQWQVQLQPLDYWQQEGHQLALHHQYVHADYRDHLSSLHVQLAHQARFLPRTPCSCPTGSRHARQHGAVASHLSCVPAEQGPKS